MNRQALKERAMRKIAEVMRPHGGHWVGNGFLVRTLFSYGDVRRVALTSSLISDAEAALLG
jgi:hypothetical protein